MIKLTLENLENQDQESLIKLFFDWYDANNSNPCKEFHDNLKQIRSLINIHTTTGINY